MRDPEKPTNKERAETALLALNSQEKYHNAIEGLPSNIANLMADLLHLARMNYIEPNYIATTAQMNFRAEMQEEFDAARQAAEEALARPREWECTGYNDQNKIGG